LIARTGRLSPANPEEIEWTEPCKVVHEDDPEYPALATDGVHVVATYEKSDYGYYLWYSAGKILE
jgi:hypothetical protein